MKKIDVTVHGTHEDTLFPQSFNAFPQKDRKRAVTFLRALQKASVEEDVKAAYRDFFSLPQDSSKRRDLYTPQMLFEFKFDKNLDNYKIRADVLAQILYYVHRQKYNTNDENIPPFLCLADVNKTVVTETILWQSFYDNDRYDWTAAPSSPDTLLINDLQKCEILKQLRVFHLFEINELVALDEFFQRIFRNDFDHSLIVKRNITEKNFEDIYRYWYEKFGEDVKNGYKPSQYFICDIQEGKTWVREDTSRVCFDIEEGVSRMKKLSLKDYMEFWELYNRNPQGDVDNIRGILSKADRLSDDMKRRMEGEFYTPIHLAQKAVEYLDTVVGGDLRKIDWNSGQYRLWDMACGTGNLEYHLPSKAYPYCYMSTLRSEDVIYCKGVFHGANVFQYDYLNDDVDIVVGKNGFLGYKMPQSLVNDLNNPQLKWIIFINPPFGTAQNKKDAKESKDGISMTRIQIYMTQQKLGETSRELFSQFLFRIHHEFKNKKAWLGLFSKIKYLNSNNDQKLRESIFRYEFKKGFIFDARVFDGVTGVYPIGFLVWNLSKWQNNFYNQDILVEICKKNGDAYDTKLLNAIDRKLLINKWVERPAATITFPPFSSALNVNADKSDLRDRISRGFICSLCSKGNDMQNQKYIALYSGPYGSAGAYSVTKDNFLKSMVIHAVRKTAKGDWSNDRDQFCIPYLYYMHDEVVRQLGYEEGVTPEFPMEFARDCVVWSLFASSNQTSALKDVTYKNKTYQIHNNLFPFSLSQVKKWGIQDQDIAITTMAEDDDRFAAKWLADNLELLSVAALEVIDKAKDVYRVYFTNLNAIKTNRFKIKTWDAGRYQIVHSMEDAEIGLEEIEKLDDALKKLGDKIRSQIHTLGFLR